MNACGGAVFPVAVNMVAWMRVVVFASEEARDVRDQTRRSFPARVDLGASAQSYQVSYRQRPTVTCFLFSFSLDYYYEMRS